ncbi:MAG: twin-arginine translocase TatA/TatE family subunit [Deltaproteobacteria bacterium]|nr:MAG: twin-arginine translocase TatA/TatE family subunit [Deltaproteobacteria bacterium]
MYFALLNGGEILVILIAILILFGGSRLPQLGDALGKGIRNFRRAVGGKKDEEGEEKESEKKEPLALPPHDPSKESIGVAKKEEQKQNS